MNYSEDFYSRDLVIALAERIKNLTAGIETPITLMEVCGTHTMAIAESGLKVLLPHQVQLVSGPGCPVCVTANCFIDRAVALSRLPDVIIVTFGDMMRVPGSSTSLMEERAMGRDIRIVYSPLDAVALAARNPDRKIIFLGIGFETTAPTIAGSILVADRQKLENFFVLAAHKTMPKAMEALAADPELALDGFICPAHVSAVIGAEPYQFLADSYGIPCVITGFEPVDIMQGVEMLIRQKLKGESRVEIQYSRVVKWPGNKKAEGVLAQVFTSCDADWRGIGTIAGSGLKINAAYARFDAEKMIPVKVEKLKEHSGCKCGEILKGKLQPRNCLLFGKECTPEKPVGACMVSAEGSCAAFFKYEVF